MGIKKHQLDIDTKKSPTDLKNSMLILHNDEVNSFEHVIDCLVSICRHDSVQAEQCAFITHHKGKCDIKKGSFKTLKAMKDALIEEGLNCTIE